MCAGRYIKSNWDSEFVAPDKNVNVKESLLRWQLDPIICPRLQGKASNPHMFSLSSNCARARLMSSCINNNSSSRANFFASAGFERARRRSSTDRRDFRDGPAACWHYIWGSSQIFEVRKIGRGDTYNICDVFYQDFFHYIYGVVCWITIIAKSVHKIPHWEELFY